MPQFVRKRRGWDWFTPGREHHLPREEMNRLVNAARDVSMKDGLQLFFVFPMLLSYVVAFWIPIMQRELLVSFSVRAGFALLVAVPVLICGGSLYRRRQVFRRTLRG